MTVSDDQDEMSMEEILASIRKYVGEGQGKTSSTGPKNNNMDLPEKKKNSDLNSPKTEEKKIFHLGNIDELSTQKNSNKESKLNSAPINPTHNSYHQSSPFDALEEFVSVKKKIQDDFYHSPAPKKDAQKQEPYQVQEFLISIIQPAIDAWCEKNMHHLSKSIIHEWCDKNIRKIAEDMIKTEIDKIKKKY
jgi:cell pole-organizing protein PopZ